jgi:TPR repeat protein
MPAKLISCISLPPATRSSVPIYDFAKANTELAKENMEQYFPIICRGCMYSFNQTDNDDKCPFCNSDCGGKSEEEEVAEMMKRVGANDAASICMLADSYYQGLNGFQQDLTKAIELYVRAGELGCCKAYCNLGMLYIEGGNFKKSKFYHAAAAMAGYEVARCNLGNMEFESGNMERALKHLRIAASAGHCKAMHQLRTFLNKVLLVENQSNQL